MKTLSIVTFLLQANLLLAGGVDTSNATSAGHSVGAIVDTTIGYVQGTASKLRPDVSAYLGIPFAQPPIGDLRFKAPVPATRYNHTINATQFSPDCPANLVPVPKTNFGLTLPDNAYNILNDLAQTNDTLSEDCLTLNIWTKPGSGSRNKAVLFWIYGGGFSTGNTANPIYDGSVIADEEDVVVVSSNYRLNIFGFPGAPGSDLNNNAGLLDQRLAVEWTRDNIANFGGDPTRITLFGQSAGGASVDYYSYAYPKDPIVHSFILESGLANGAGAALPVNYSNWYAISEGLGCGGSAAGASTVECVRGKSFQQILNVSLSLGVGSFLGGGFEPVVDNKTVFGDYPARGEAGLFAHLPVLLGNVDNEGQFFKLVAFGSNPLSILPDVYYNISSWTGITCLVAQSATWRIQSLVPAWRYRYYGDYPNLQIPLISGAYHTVELPVLFGTAASASGAPSTAAENGTGVFMRKAWSAFAQDPYHGLLELGWPHYNPNTKSLARLGYQNETEPSYIFNKDTDATCQLGTCASELFLGNPSNFGDLETIYDHLSSIIPRNTTVLTDAQLDALAGVMTGGASNGSFNMDPATYMEWISCIVGLPLNSNLTALFLENLAGGQL